MKHRKKDFGIHLDEREGPTSHVIPCARQSGQSFEVKISKSKRERERTICVRGINKKGKKIQVKIFEIFQGLSRFSAWMDSTSRKASKGKEKRGSLRASTERQRDRETHKRDRKERQERGRKREKSCEPFTTRVRDEGE